MLERGDLTFFVRPRVQPADSPVATPGIQALFLLMGPAGGGPHRRVRIGRNRLPAARGQRYWAVVERVGSLERVIRDQLEAERYTTRTRGERYQPPARSIADGEYALVRHDDHVHLVYRAARREASPDPDHDAPHIPLAGGFVLLFKRPRGRAQWSAQGEPASLDHEDAELVLVAPGDEPAGEVDAAAAL